MTDKLRTKIRNYKPPKLYFTKNEKGKPSATSADHWHVFYSFIDPSTNKFKRFKVYEGINAISGVSERMDFAQEIINKYLHLLKDLSYSPFSRSTIFSSSPFFSELISDFIKDKLESADLKTVLGYESNLLKFSAYLGLNFRAQEVTRNQIKDFLSKQAIQKAWKPKTYNEYLSEIRQLFSWAIDQDDSTLTVNPAAKIKRRAVLKDANPPLNDIDLATVLNYAKMHEPYFYLFYRTMYYTCFRPTREMRLLRVKHIDFDRKQINLPADISKTGKKMGKGRTIQMADQLVVLLEEAGIRGASPDSFVFTESLTPGKEPVLITYFPLAFERIKEATSLPFSVKMYAIKHTRVCHMVIDKVPLYRIQQLTGHATLAQLMDYLKGLHLIIDEDELIASRDL